MAGFTPAPSPSPAEGGGTGATQVDLIIDNDGDPTAVTYYTNQGGRGVVDTTALAGGLVLASGTHGHRILTTGDENGIESGGGTQLPDGLYVSLGAEQDYGGAVFLVVWGGNASVLEPEAAVTGGLTVVSYIATSIDEGTITVLHNDGSTEVHNWEDLADGTFVFYSAPGEGSLTTFTGGSPGASSDADRGYYVSDASNPGGLDDVDSASAVLALVWAKNQTVILHPAIPTAPGLVDLIVLLDDPTTATTTGMTVLHVDGTTETIDSSDLPDGTTVLDVSPSQNIQYTINSLGYLTNGTTAVPGLYTSSTATGGVTAATTGGVLCAGVTVLVWAQNQSVAVSPQAG